VKAGRNEAKKWGSKRRAARHKRFYGLEQNQTTLSPYVTSTKRAKGPGCSNSSPLDLTRNCTNGAHSGIVDQPQPNFADIAKCLFVDTKEMDDNTSLAYPDDELSEEEERAITDWSKRIKVWENMTKEETESVQQLIRLCDDRKKRRRDVIPYCIVEKDLGGGALLMMKIATPPAYPQSLGQWAKRRSPSSKARVVQFWVIARCGQ
jgi:hypothetical protein